MIKSTVTIFLVIAFFYPFSCKKDTSPIIAKIFPGESIEGVSLGASKQEVEKVLGEFNICGRGDGLVRSWYSANFFGSGNNCTDGLTLHFIWGVDGDPNAIGPLDMFSFRAPYTGKTNEGIGIGSSVESVREAYGEPDKIHEDSRGIKYTYCYDSGYHFMVITFTNRSTSIIDLGYYKPMPKGYGVCD